VDWSSVSIEDQRRVVKVFADDGHTIWGRDTLQAEGLLDVLMPFYKVFRSDPDGDPKQTIFVDEQPVTALRGVYGLEVLESLAFQHHIQGQSLGRGFRARELTAALRQKLGE
jgi:hypothetical protein